MENQMNIGISSLLRRIYRIVMFSFFLNVVCTIVLIWKLLIVSPAYTAFSSELRNLFERIHQVETQSSSYPKALQEESTLVERDSCVLSPIKQLIFGIVTSTIVLLIFIRLWRIQMTRIWQTLRFVTIPSVIIELFPSHDMKPLICYLIVQLQPSALLMTSREPSQLH